MKTKVRCDNKMVFEINPDTLEAKTCSSYDPWCYSDPDPNVNYIEFYEWISKSSKLERLSRGR